MTKKSKILIAAAAVVGVVIVGSAMSGAGNGDTATAASPETPTTVTTEPPTTTTTEPERTWSPSDFQIDLIVLEDKCFGSAGGLVTLEPDLGVSNLEELDRDLDVVYEVRGGEYGAETYRLEVGADGQFSYDELNMSTAKCGDKLTATIVNVIDR